MSCMSDFDDYSFCLPQIWGKRKDILKFFFTVTIRYLKQPPVMFLQQLNDYSWNDVVSKLVDDFLASRYASMTTKSSHFVWSITSRNLNHFFLISFLESA